MRFLSTRGKSPALGFSEAVVQSLAPDGGLYVPEQFPSLKGENLASWMLQDSWEGVELAKLAEKTLRPFIAGDSHEKKLENVCREAFHFPIKMSFLDSKTAVLELFHGPTAAFKDFGASFLASWVVQNGLFRSGQPPASVPLLDEKPALVLVATSGDTGGAVASAFFMKPGIEGVILFPKGRVAPRQQKQLTCWGGNIRAFAVEGSFDDCQRLAKQALNDPEVRSSRKLISANSINLGRLLPQVVYYAAGSLQYFRKHSQAAGFIVPSGNLGNSVAAMIAMEMGFPIREVVLATNANRSVPDYLATGQWEPRPTIATLANAMDVGNPSNIERVWNLYPEIQQLRGRIRAFSVSDDQIRATIKKAKTKWNQVFCPHTATAAFVHESLASSEPRHWVLVATAHPAKFDTIVEPLIGATVSVPESLQNLLDREERYEIIPADFAVLKKQILEPSSK